MSGPDYDTRFEEAAREKWLEERDNKPVLEFDFEKYVRYQIRLLCDRQIDYTEFATALCEVENLLHNLESANAEIAYYLEQSKKEELTRTQCKFKLRKLMEGLG